MSYHGVTVSHRFRNVHLSLTALPQQPRRIILVNPTRYLGNLLIAGGLIQAFQHHCASRGITLRVVLDAAYAELVRDALPADVLIPYPRRQIATANLGEKARLYFNCLREIRRFRADIAFNIEEDSVSHRLTQLSGAAFRLGCSTQRHGFGYHHVLPVNFAGRAPEHRHRWYSFLEVFQALGLPALEPQYLQLQAGRLPEPVGARLQSLGLEFGTSLAVLHVGATKAYKKWPYQHFADLACRLQSAGHQVVFTGAGGDAHDIAEVLALVPAARRGGMISICGELSLRELAAFLRHAAVFIGNDSGPFHLAAALGVKGVVIFGPTSVDLWKPLTPTAHVLKGTEFCSPDCTRKQCLYQHRCLRSISPERVMEELKVLSVVAPAAR